MDRDALVLLRARRKDEVEEELTREARRGRGEHLLERWSPGGGRTRKIKNMYKEATTFLHSSDGSLSYLFTKLPVAVTVVSFHGLVSRW